jgi:hypothetical protein
MPLNHGVAKTLSFLRKKYNVKERDLVAIAKKFESASEPEETWEDIMIRTMRNRKGRFVRAPHRKR